MNGTIKTKTEKNFGFIEPDSGEKDVFFHASSLVGVTFEELRATKDDVKGDKVSFEMTEGAKGPAAANVQRI